MAGHELWIISLSTDAPCAPILPIKIISPRASASAPTWALTLPLALAPTLTVATALTLTLPLALALTVASILTLALTRIVGPTATATLTLI